MKFEIAEVRAVAMIAALGKGWVMDLVDDHGWRCCVKNGPCHVSYSENSQEYAASIRLGSTLYAGYGKNPVRAMEVAILKMDASFARISKEHDAIKAVVSGMVVES